MQAYGKGSERIIAEPLPKSREFSLLGAQFGRGAIRHGGGVEGSATEGVSLAPCWQPPGRALPAFVFIKDPPCLGPGDQMAIIEPSLSPESLPGGHSAITSTPSMHFSGQEYGTDEAKCHPNPEPRKPLYDGWVFHKCILDTATCNCVVRHEIFE